MHVMSEVLDPSMYLYHREHLKSTHFVFKWCPLSSGRGRDAHVYDMIEAVIS